MAAISREEVAHLAHLSRLAVTDQELDQFAGQLDVILQSVARIGSILGGTEHSWPRSHAVDSRCSSPNSTCVTTA